MLMILKLNLKTTLSVKNLSVKSDEFFFRWRIFIADENFYRRIFYW